MSASSNVFKSSDNTLDLLISTWRGRGLMMSQDEHWKSPTPFQSTFLQQAVNYITAPSLGSMHNPVYRIFTMAASQCLLWLLLLVPCCWSQLHYGLFTAGGSGGFSSSCVEPAIQLAEDTINNNSTLLSNYSLSHTGVMDTQVTTIIHCYI